MKKDGLTKNTMLLAIGVLINKGLLLIMLPYFSRWLSVGDYGTFDLLSTYVTLLLPIVTLSCGEGMFRFSVDVETVEEKQPYVSSSLAIALFNGAVASVALFAIQLFTGWPLALPFALLMIGQVLNAHLQSFLRAIKRLNVYSFASAITTLFIAFGVICLILGRGLKLEGILYGYALGFLMGDAVIIVWMRYWRYVRLRKVSGQVIRQLIGYSFPLIPNDVSWWVMNASDRFIINIFFGSVANGIFAIAHKIPSLCSSVFSMFCLSWQQAAIENNGEQRDAYYNSVLNKMVAILISLCVGILSLNFLFFNVIFDERYVSAALYAPILIIAIAFMSLSQFFGGIQISLKRPKENGLTTVIGAVTNIILMLGMIKWLGLYAAALSTLIANALVMGLRWWRLSREISFYIAKRNFLYIAILMYFFAASYFIENNVLNIINLVLAFALFLYINRDFEYRFLQRGRCILEKIKKAS